MGATAAARRTIATAPGDSRDCTSDNHDRTGDNRDCTPDDCHHLGGDRGPAATPLGYAVAMLVPQRLMLYHPRQSTKVLRVHVEHLRAHGFVWWGRFYGGEERFDAPAAQARWSHVAELAEARAKAREPSILFVSNHVELHAGKVTEVGFGDDAPGGRAARPSPTVQSGRSRSGSGSRTCGRFRTTTR